MQFSLQPQKYNSDSAIYGFGYVPMFKSQGMVQEMGNHNSWRFFFGDGLSQLLLINFDEDKFLLDLERETEKKQEKRKHVKRESKVLHET